MKKNIIGLLVLFMIVVFIAGCVSTECTRTGQILWTRGFHPDKDAPGWTASLKKAANEIGVSMRRIPDKVIVVIGVSEDKNNEKGAQASGLDNMLQRYAVYLKKDLDRIMKQAVSNLDMSMPNLDTAVGAAKAVRYIPDRNYQSALVKNSWQAQGRRCLDQGDEAVYRVFVLGVIEREERQEHLKEAAKETFKYALVQKDKKNAILEEAEKLIDKNKF